jgi:NAD(P)-dependent dehydrogenase (short-subunit alcohol dehydrogenase family)
VPGPTLTSRVVVVPIGADGGIVARRLAAEGATVVIVASDDEAEGAGRLAGDIETGGGGRPAVFTTAGHSDDPADLDALVEYLGEMFRT